jgi:hypothetical protein
MLIISKYSDYYDQISNIYGIDRKIVFNRTQTLPSSIKLNVVDEIILPFPQITISFNPVRFYNDTTEKLYNMMKEKNISSFKILSVCGKPFYIGHVNVKYDRDYRLISESKDVVISNEFEELLLEHMTGWRDENLTMQPKRYLERLHKEAKSPIIMLIPEFCNIRQYSYGDHIFAMEEAIPNLSKIEGFAKRYSKEQVYQDISYWISNILNESPDVQPVGKPPQSDKEKILSHGLDLKRSFRHRRDDNREIKSKMGFSRIGLNNA